MSEKIITLETNNGKTITFNKLQVDAIESIMDWLKSDKLYYTLAGVAGSGKSTISKKIVELSGIRSGYICISAPTHKAKKVVSRMSGFDGVTLHSILGLRPDVELSDYDPNFPQFNPIAEPKIGDFKLILIDEASMINENLFKLIKKLNEGSKVKILFMGDPCQIPPVGEVDSVVFFDQSIEVFWLTEVMRQSDSNPLMYFYDLLRNNLDDLYGGLIRKTTVNEKGEGIIFTKDRNGFRKMIIEYFTSLEFKRNTEHVKLIAWTNDAVSKSNLLIRSAIFSPDAEIVEVNDILMGYRTISDDKMKFNIIENSADYRVLSKSGLEENQFGILGYRLKLRENIGDNEYFHTNIFLVDTSNFDNMHKYAETHDRLRDNAVRTKALWKKYYEFRRKTMILVDINKYRNGRERPKGEYIVKDLSYGYAITAHKSQGSTYNTVFVLEDDINGNWLINEKNRIKYVAFSRPSVKAIVLSNWTED